MFGRALWWWLWIGVIAVLAAFFLFASSNTGFSLKGDVPKETSQTRPILEEEVPGKSERGGRSYVFWLNVDGLRGGLIREAQAEPLLTWRQTSAWTEELRPLFPSLTFSTHASMATGKGVMQHGIASNVYWDREAMKEHRFTGDSSQLMAEPIWHTATRQGLKTVVLDWPLSQSQTGEIRAAVFQERFEPELSDEERMERMLSAWKKERPRLFMGYLKDPDTLGHQAGPQAPATLEATRKTAKLIEKAEWVLREEFDRFREPEDEFWLVLSSDHGMASIRHLVNLKALMGADLSNAFLLAVSGPVANLYLKPEQESHRETLLNQVDQWLVGHPMIQGFAPEKLPKHWNYNNPQRMGERILILEEGWMFSSKYLQPIREKGPEDVNGMHGYPVEKVPSMHAELMIRRYPIPLESRPLGKVAQEEMHAVVCHLLGIEPAELASKTRLNF